MSHEYPFVVSARLTRKQLSAIESVAASRHTTISGVVQHAVVSLAAGESARVDGLFRDLLTKLGLDPDAATRQQIEDAMQPLVDAIALPEGTDPLAATPGGSAASDFADKPKALSSAEAAACVRRGVAPTLENWGLLKRNAAARLGRDR